MLWFSKGFARAVGGMSIALLAFDGVAPGIVQAATNAEKAQQFAAAIQTSMTAIEDSDRDAPRDRWDPAYVVQTIGVEPETLFAWQRANVSWVPYRGALRGPTGVLMDRKGNSLDQALLFAALLARAGKTVRLAHADLPADIVSAAMQRITASPVALAIDGVGGPMSKVEAASAADTYANSEDFTNTADAYGIDHEKVTASLKSSVTRANDIAIVLDQRARDQSARLLAVAGLPDAATARRTLDVETRAALADHWWVQMLSGGAWTDFDVLAPSGKAGSALAVATGSVAPDALSDAFNHTVTVRVVVDQWKAGKTAERVALEKTLAARNLIGTRLQLMHSPTSWPPDWPQTTPDDVQIKLRAAVYTQAEWVPALLIDSQPFAHDSIRDSGEINEHPSGNNPFRDMSITAVGALEKASDTLATLADPAAKLPENKEAKIPNMPRADGELVAEWLEFEIRAPGAKPRKIRRQIFDLLGPAARSGPDVAKFMMSEEKKLARATVMLEQTEILIQPAALAPEYVTHLVALNALANKDVFDEVSADPFSKIPTNYVELFSKVVTMPAALYAFASMRLESNAQGDNLFMDRPLIVLQHGGLRRGGGGDFYVRYSLDIVDNAIGVDPRTRGNPAEIRLRQGVIDSNAEGQALRLAGQPLVTSTGDSFAAAAKAGRAWTALKPGTEARLPMLHAPADLSAQLLSDLKAGNVVVSLANPAVGDRGGWWRIDPATGTTLGMGPEGNGQAMVEYAVVMLLQAVISSAQCLVAGAASKAIEKTLDEMDLRNGNTGLTAGYEAGKEQASKSLENARKDHGHHCFAVGMMGAIDTGLMFGTFALAKRMTKSNLPPPAPGNEPPPNIREAPPEAPNNNDAAARAERAAAEAKQQAELAKTAVQEAEQKVDDARKEAKEAAERAQQEQDKLYEADEKIQAEWEGKLRELRRQYPTREDIQRAQDNANREAAEATKTYQADPTPENKAALDAAKSNLLDISNAKIVRGSKGIPYPPVPGDFVQSPSPDAALQSPPRGSPPPGQGPTPPPAQLGATDLRPLGNAQASPPPAPTTVVGPFGNVQASPSPAPPTTTVPLNAMADALSNFKP